jgi:ATP-binding cassette subfamily C protein
MNPLFRDFLRQCGGPILAVAALSGGSNLLALTGSIFMLATYDRVIPSGSIPTLVALGLMAILAYGIQAMIDIFRGKILTRLGLVVKESLGPRVFDIVVRNAAAGNQQPASAVRDLDQVQGFLSSMGPTALFDLPWLPIYLAICFFFHVYVGIAVSAGAVVLILITIVSNALTRAPTRDLAEATNERSLMLAASQSQAETLQSMGMTLNLSARWNGIGNRIVRTNRNLSDTTSALSIVSRVFRMMLQSFVLALGAYLVIMGNASGGIMIASSILASRALAPIELTIGNWRGFVSARQSWRRLSDLLAQNPSEGQRFMPPRPEREFQCENVSLALAAQRRILVRDVSFSLVAGESLAIVGPTGSGKSTLARGLVGLWPPAIGAIRLDGMGIEDWPSAERGRLIGYLPQTVSLIEGTVAENVARFDPHARSEDVIRAAKAAGVHQLISRLPDGYDTRLGMNGSGLSGGQAQRIGLARALYGEPFLVVLDEPNSNLDSDGDVALGEALQSVRARGGISIIISHRRAILASVDRLMVLVDGRVQKSGSRQEVLSFLRAPEAAVA